MPKRKKIRAADIETALKRVARLIERHGDAYWPIFERLEKELDERRSRRARLNAHLTSDTSTL